MMTSERSLAWIVILAIVAIVFTMCSSPNANAGELDAWEFNICGINTKDFQDRQWHKIALGAVSSLAVHELGHIVVSELNGSSTSVRWDSSGPIVWSVSDKPLSNDRLALYSAAGFISQTIVGAALVAIPKTRHLDFTFGFTSYSSVNSVTYAITDGTVDYASDTQNIDKYGYDGTTIALGTGVINGALSWVSLNKDNQ